MKTSAWVSKKGIVSHLIFNGQYYDQIDGVAMGSPLGSFLANIFTCHFEEKWFLNNNFHPSVWFRYVDDTFTLFDNSWFSCDVIIFQN